MLVDLLNPTGTDAHRVGGTAFQRPDELRVPPAWDNVDLPQPASLPALQAAVKERSAFYSSARRTQRDAEAESAERARKWSAEAADELLASRQILSNDVKCHWAAVQHACPAWLQTAARLTWWDLLLHQARLFPAFLA